MNAGKLRNKSCPCGSGKKFKKCCMLTGQQKREKAAEAPTALQRFMFFSTIGEDKERELAEEERIRRGVETAKVDFAINGPDGHQAAGDEVRAENIVSSFEAFVP